MMNESDPMLSAACAGELTDILQRLQRFVARYKGCAALQLEVTGADAVSAVIMRDVTNGQIPVMTATALVLPDFIDAPVLSDVPDYAEHEHAEVVRQLALCPPTMRAFYTMARDSHKQEWLSALLLRLAALPHRLARLCVSAITQWLELSEHMRRNVNEEPALVDMINRSLDDFGANTGATLQRLAAALIAEKIEQLVENPPTPDGGTTTLTAGQLRETLRDVTRCATLLDMPVERVDTRLLSNQLVRHIPASVSDDTVIIASGAQHIDDAPQETDDDAE